MNCKLAGNAGKLQGNPQGWIFDFTGRCGIKIEVPGSNRSCKHVRWMWNIFPVTASEWIFLPSTDAPTAIRSRFFRGSIVRTAKVFCQMILRSHCRLSWLLIAGLLWFFRDVRLRCSLGVLLLCWFWWLRRQAHSSYLSQAGKVNIRCSTNLSSST